MFENAAAVRFGVMVSNLGASLVDEREGPPLVARHIYAAAYALAFKSALSRLPGAEEEVDEALCRKLSVSCHGLATAASMSSLVALDEFERMEEEDDA